MKRRDFIKAIVPVGFLAGNVFSLATSSNAFEDIVVVKNELPHLRFRKGIEEIGGIGRFVKKGQRVAIKPAMAYDQAPESGLNSNPLLVEEIIKQCRVAGARSVSVFDHTIESWTKCYKNSGIERIAKDAEARVLPANNEMFYSEINLAEPQELKTVKIHNSILEADVFINVAVARIDEKHGYLGSVKNLAGCIWSRQNIALPGNDKAMAELMYYIKPELTILDSTDFQVLTTDCVAADSLAFQFLNRNTDNIEYLKIADELGFGDSRIKVSDVRTLNPF
ncbi:MAG: DUF362 domain-containing protein [Mariniphaga sp.]|nr:DUF362 domain-containing protein [Mariniphaga sp.]